MTIATIADRAGPYLSLANIVVFAVVLWFIVRTRDGKARIALISIVATIVIIFTLGLIQSLLRQAGYRLDTMYICLAVARVVTFCFGVWLVTLLWHRDNVT